MLSVYHTYELSQRQNWFSCTVTGQLADWSTRRLCVLSFCSSGGICETARCPVRELAIRELAYPRVVQLPLMLPSVRCDAIRFSDFHRIMEWWGSKCRLWVRILAKIGVFRASDFKGARMNIPIGYNQYQNVLHRVARFRRSRFRDVEISVDGIKKSHE